MKKTLQELKAKKKEEKREEKKAIKKVKKAIKKGKTTDKGEALEDLSNRGTNYPEFEEETRT